MSSASTPIRGRPGQQTLRSKALPRSQPPPDPKTPPSQTSRPRTSHACDRCRIMRTKCSGGTRCTKCVKDNQTCLYGDGKREKNKKELAESSSRIESLEYEIAQLVTLLRNIASDPASNVASSEELNIVLSRYPTDDRSLSNSGIGDLNVLDPFIHSSRGSSRSLHSGGLLLHELSSAETEVWGERHTSATVGSPGAQDQLSEAVDLGHGTGAAGFMGKMSEVSWIQRVKEHLLILPTSPHQSIETLQFQFDRHTRDTNKWNYFTDDVDLLSVNEDLLIPQQMPPPDLSFLMAEAYFHSIQGAFNFVSREEFLETLSRFLHSDKPLSWTERRWLALANLVFALGARWLQQTEPEGAPLIYNHLEFYARARALGIDHRVGLDHPDLVQIQSLGLLAFYLFLNHSVLRSWSILGHAIRHATALGLHLRVADSKISRDERIRRACTWHSLYCLEILISEVTGRPRAVALSDITAPINILEELSETKEFSEHFEYGAEGESRRQWLQFLEQHRQPLLFVAEGERPLHSLIGIGSEPPSSHFTNRIRLCYVSHRIGTDLYSSNENMTWSDVQERTKRLEATLFQWEGNLPPELSIGAPQTVQVDPRPRIELAMYSCSLRMILHRPCLCNIVIENESPQSKQFDIDSARSCVEAAISMINLMPNSQTARESFLLLPWWAVLHYLAQAIAVLQLEICLKMAHLPGELNRVTFSLKRAMLYLYRMASTSRSAYKAWTIFRHVLDLTMRSDLVGVDISDMPVDAPRPANWDLAFESTMQEQGFLQPNPLAGIQPGFPMSYSD